MYGREWSTRRILLGEIVSWRDSARTLSPSQELGLEKNERSSSHGLYSPNLKNPMSQSEHTRRSPETYQKNPFIWGNVNVRVPLLTKHKHSNGKLAIQISPIKGQYFPLKKTLLFVHYFKKKRRKEKPWRPSTILTKLKTNKLWVTQ